MHPRVSFIVASYNYERYIAQAIDSLLDQSFTSLEVIVIDDCSPDNSRAVLERYRDNPRVRLVFHEQNRGHIYTRNEGLAMARGEYVAVMDSDDYCYREDAVARHVAVLDAHPEVGFVYSAYQLVDEQNTPFRVVQPAQQDEVRDGLDEFAQLIWRNYIPHTGTLVRRSVLDKLGGYDPELPHSADWDLWLRLSTLARVGYLATPYYAYRIHTASMSVARHSPHQINGEFLRTVNKAFDALPADAPARIRHLRRAACQRVLLNCSWGDRSHGRVRRSWEGLVSAAWRSPSLLIAPAFHAALARLAVLTLVGHRRYERLVGLARGRRQQVRLATGH